MMLRHAGQACERWYLRGVSEQPRDFDLTVIGSGAAGLMAAVSARSLGRVAILTDRGVGTSNSAVAQGGLQFPDDSPEAIDRFRKDMLASGGSGVDVRRLEHFTRSVREVVLLLEEWGLELDRDASGNLIKVSAGGLSEPRIVTAGARIGPAILRVLKSRLADTDVEVHTKMRVVDIDPRDDGPGFNVVGDRESFRSSAVIVATGGRSFQHAGGAGLDTSNPVNDNASMHDLLRSLGLVEREADLFQFHPYGLVAASGAATGKCVPESIVSMGGYVADAQGTRLVDPTADRADVTAAMQQCFDRSDGVQRGDGQACRLVLSDVNQEAFFARYPHVERQMVSARLADGDVAVRPVVHYQLGGFAVAPDGSTEIPGLYLAGELTGGLHGRNRLMGNGITEAVVDGWTAARAVLAAAASVPKPS